MIVRLPNGQQVNFPDDMPQNEIKALIANRFPEETALKANPNASSLPGPLGDFQNTSRAMSAGMMQGMTLGFGDELEAGVFALPEAIGNAFQGKGFDLGQGYNQALDRSRQNNEASADLNQVANIAGNIGGNMALAGGMSQGGLSLMAGAKPTIGSMAGRGAIEGLLYGAVTGLGTGETMEERLQQAATGGAVGGVLGGAAGSVAGALANKATAAAAPVADDLFQEADQLYEAVRNSGVVFPQPSVQGVADDIAAKAISEGLDPDLHPMATAALKRLQTASANNLTAQDAHTIRRILAAAKSNMTNPDQARIAGIMTREFDNFIGQSIPEFGAANLVNQTAHKTQLIESTIQKARDMAGPNYSASGFEQALRAQFKNLVTSPSALRGFSPEEVAAIRQVANGGPIENILRYIGKAAPTGIVSGGIAGGAGYAVGGLPGAAAVLGAGGLARKAATASTLNNANLARALIANGGHLPQMSSPVANALGGLVPAAGGIGGSQGSQLLQRALFGQ